MAVANAQILVGPAIKPGIGGAVEIERDLAKLVAQELLAFTVIDPEANIDEILTVRLVPVVVIGEFPSVEVTPVGSVQMYEVAPADAAAVYVADVVPQTTVGPEIDAGTAGLLFIAKVFGELDAQALFAVTEIVPLVNVLAKLTVIPVPVVVTGEAPREEVTPVGRVQV